MGDLTLAVSRRPVIVLFSHETTEQADTSARREAIRTTIVHVLVLGS